MRKASLTLLLVAFSLAIEAQYRIDTQLTSIVRWDKPQVQNRQATPGKPKKAEGLSATQRAVGHLFGNPDSITIKGAMVGTAGIYPVATAIGPDILDRYVGCKVVGIRAAVAQSLGKCNTFLYTVADGSLSDTPLTKNQRLYEGWNNVFYNGDTALEIEEGMTLLVGFDYTETERMVEAGSGGLCTVGKANGENFLIYTDFGSGEGWYSVNNLGALCVQLIVDVSNLPEKALGLSYLDTGFRYKKAGERVEMYVIADNLGRENLDSYRLTCQLDDQTPVEFSYTDPLPEQGSVHLQPVFTLPSDITLGPHILTVSLFTDDETNQTGQTAVAEEKATSSADFYIYNESLARQKAYVEQYNSQDEYMASIVNPLFEQVAKSNEEMVLVNVYQPGDPLAIEDAAYLHDLYAYTLPSFTVNRSYFPGESYIAYDVNYYAEQYAPLVPTIIDELVRQDMGQPAFATIDFDARYDNGTRQLTIDITGTLAEGALDILGTPSVTLLLTENNVKSKQTVINQITQRTTTQQDYTHQHVLRKFATPPTGAPVEVSGNQYTARHTVSIDPSWKLEEMTLVGFVTRTVEEVTDDNVLTMDITNCNSISLKELTGIHSLETSNGNPQPEYFLTNGQRVNPGNLNKGIYIIREGGKSRKILKIED